MLEATERLSCLTPMNLRRYIVCIALGLIFLGFNCASAGFLKVDPLHPDDQPWEMKGLDPNTALVVFISGGGSASDEQRRERAAHFTERQVVIYRPTGPFYTAGDMRPLQDFLATRREILGRNLHFLVSSAGVPAFENYIYDPRYLPRTIGAVILVQPFEPRILFFNPDRPILTDQIVPDLHVVYDLRMPEALVHYFRAGPSQFESLINDSRYIPYGRPENRARNGDETVCQHGIVVGPSEDLATSVLTWMIAGNKERASQILDQQERWFGLGSPEADDPITVCLRASSVGDCEAGYNLEIIARNMLDGQATSRSSFGWGPSINDRGDVAFTTERYDGREAIAVVERGEDSLSLRTGGYQAHLDYGNIVQINNDGQVAWRQRSVDPRTDTLDQILSDIIVGGISVEESKWAARKGYDRIDTQEVDIPSVFGKPLFVLSPVFSPGISINNDGRPVFAGRLWNRPNVRVLATPLDLDPFRQDFINGYHLGGAMEGAPEFYPMVADNNVTVVRWGDEIDSPIVVFSDETLTTGEIRAGSGFFRAIGEKPGISDDGNMITFVGDHVALGGGFYGLTEARGFKVAGMSGDGNWDPGEVWDDTNQNGNVNQGEDIGPFINLSLTPRVCVNRYEASSDRRYSAAYLTTEESGRFGLFTSEIDAADPSAPEVRQPVPVVITGDMLEDHVGGSDPLSGVVQDIGLYDAVNNNGEVVAWVRTSTGEQAIVRALPPVNEINRWWATAGDPAFEVQWRVRVCRTGAYKFVLRLDGPQEDWDIVGPSEVRITGPNNYQRTLALEFKRNRARFRIGTADLGQLLAGIYTISVRDFMPPASPAVDPIHFQLTDASDAGSVSVALSSLFIADHPAVDTSEILNIRVDGEIRSRTITALAELFTPMLHFNNGEWFPYSFDVDETTWKQQPMPLRGNAEAEMDLWVYRRPWPLVVANQQPTLYASAVENQDGLRLALNYWFHFPRSNWGELGGVNTHEGDWEGITVFFKRDATGPLIWEPDEVAFAQHVKLLGGVHESVDGGDKLPWDETDRQDTHVNVYIGLGGHASYSHSGSTAWLNCNDLSLSPMTDAEHHNGTVAGGMHQVVYLPQVGQGPRSEGGVAPTWLLYSGRWGSLDLFNDGSFLCNRGDDAPRGPAFLHGGDSRPGERWLNPWAWAESFSGAGFNPPN